MLSVGAPGKNGRPYDRRGCINTLEQMWGYGKKDAEPEEKERFQHLLQKTSRQQRNLLGKSQTFCQTVQYFME
ncbi:DUF1722 domain-containing protein [Salibacterium sp. K-3]